MRMSTYQVARLLQRAARMKGAGTGAEGRPQAPSLAEGVAVQLSAAAAEKVAAAVDEALPGSSSSAAGDATASGQPSAGQQEPPARIPQALIDADPLDDRVRAELERRAARFVRHPARPPLRFEGDGEP